MIKTKGCPYAYFHETKNAQQNYKQIPYTKRHLNRAKHVDNMDINSLRLKLCTMPFIKDDVQQVLNHQINIYLFRNLFKFEEMR
jgi:hypothetical protein